MRILLVHESYQQPGGEDAVAAAEAAQLELHGHTVLRYFRHNNELMGQSSLRVFAAGIGTVWAAEAYRDLRKLIKTERPEVVHFHNTLPLISPSAYYACARAQVPVVQTLHNYRLICPSATFLRNGEVCESCLGRSLAWPSVVHACYRKNRAATAAIATMLAAHRGLRTWQTKVDIYIALSEFARKKFVQGGLPAQRLVVKPNFVHPDPGSRSRLELGSYALFVGRLSEEKGLLGLLTAWARLSQAIPLYILGDGPMREEMGTLVRALGLSGVTVLGTLPRSEVFRWMKGARFLTFPSHWFEGCPLAIVEALACGIPVIATGLGTVPETIEHGRTGLHVAPGDSDDLAQKVDWAWSHPTEMQMMGWAARREFEVKYTAQQSYSQLTKIYQRLIDRKTDRSSGMLWNALSGPCEAERQC